MPATRTRQPRSERESTRTAGSRAERRARLHYRLRGYVVLASNVWAGGNELDLVLRRGRTLVFCEVKQKAGEGLGDPAEMVDEEKQRRLRRAAETWLATRPELDVLDVRFDVVAVSPRGLRRITDAF
jgi:putative endonuclease